jgi:hypothetical protein
MEIVRVFFEFESEISYLFEMFHSRAMIQAVSRQTLTSAVRVQVRARFVVNKVALGQTSLRALQPFPINSTNNNVPYVPSY